MYTHTYIIVHISFETHCFLACAVSRIFFQKREIYKFPWRLIATSSFSSVYFQMSYISVRRLSSVKNRYSMGSINRNLSIHGCTMCSAHSINFCNTSSTLRHYYVTPLLHQSLQLCNKVIRKQYELIYKILTQQMCRLKHVEETNRLRYSEY